MLSTAILKLTSSVFYSLSLDSSVVNNPEHKEKALEVATKSFVLLKNVNNSLPLDPSKFKKVAVRELELIHFFAWCKSLAIVYNIKDGYRLTKASHNCCCHSGFYIMRGHSHDATSLSQRSVVCFKQFNIIAIAPHQPDQPNCTDKQLRVETNLLLLGDVYCEWMETDKA